jgi:diguanylate cyclase (GGDEF)-like protein
MARFRRSRDIALWIVGLAIMCGVFFSLMREIAANELQQQAEQSALGWAQFASSSVPDLDQAFAGLGFSADARAQLRRLRHAVQVFRFKLFDPRGRQVLVSDELDAEASAPATAAPPAAHGVPAAVLAGAIHVTLKRESRADRPAVYSEAYVPIVQHGRVIGIVEVYVDQADAAATIARAHVRIAIAAALMFLLFGGAGALQLRRRATRQLDAEARIDYLAQHDLLSGTLNRASFHEAVGRAVWRCAEGNPGFALLFVDLDHFKDVNDALGHAVGDDVLRHTARRLCSVARAGDPVARLGADQFAILQSHVASAVEVSALAERVVDALAEPHDLGGRRIRCTASVGAAIHGIDGSDRDELLHRAEVALHRAKVAGRNTFSFYDPLTDERLRGRRALVHDLRDAIEANQLAVHYQPLFERDGRTCVGYEALLRWRHPTRGDIAPSEFIPLAEECGAIDALSRWVIRRACADAAAWPGALSVAVNLSPAQFRHGDLVVVVREALHASGLAATRLELEITESLLMSNTEPVLDTLHALCALGVRVAMDDFGTGYSGLAHLWRFPFDKVKIDRAFTRNLGEDAKVDLIVRSIISLAHALGIRVNAEGVETVEQMQALQRHGCDELQGFLLGRPAPLAAIDAGAASANDPTAQSHAAD